VKENENLEFKLAEAMGMILALMEFVHPNDTKARATKLWEEWHKKNIGCG